MWILVAAIVVLGVVVAVAELLMRRRGAEPAEAVQPEATCATCTGSNDKCEQECMMEAAMRPNSSATSSPPCAERRWQDGVGASICAE